MFEAREQLGRQTDGLWLVVSHGAVFKANVHGVAPGVDEWLQFLQTTRVENSYTNDLKQLATVLKHLLTIEGFP